MDDLARRVAHLALVRHQDEAMALRLAAAAKALTPEKMNDLLAKLRKGSMGGLTWGNLPQVFERIGGGFRLEKFVGLVPLFYEGNEAIVADDNLRFVQQRHEIQTRDEVSSLPMHPKLGERYVTGLTDIDILDRGGKKVYLFRYYSQIGAEGWRITSPEGKTFEVLPDGRGQSKVDGGYGELEPLAKLPILYAAAWLKKDTSFVAQVNKALGTEAPVQAGPRTRDNTGTCPACFRNIKLKGDEDSYSMVLHGFTRKRWSGPVQGRCFGVGHEPFELSPEGTKALIEEHLEPRIKQLDDQANNLASGAQTSLYLKDKIIENTHPSWDRIRDRVIEDLRSNIKDIEHDITRAKGMIAKWKKRPLPKEGDPVLMTWDE
jgi:hypothetical protein